MPRTPEKVKDPLFRCFEREVREGSRLLTRVRKDLENVAQVCEGAVKQTNHLRAIMQALSKGVIPKEWQKYHVPDSTSLSLWLVDLANRCKQWVELSVATDFYTRNIWIGGLFSPEAFMTATRQAVAQANKWALETLQLTVTISDKPLQGNSKEHIFVAVGLVLEGASFDFAAQQLTVSSDTARALPYVSFTWRQNVAASAQQLSLPVYLNEMRRDLLFSVDVAFPQGTQAATWYQRGLAITAWSADSVRSRLPLHSLMSLWRR